jgi:hypothetical protein
VASAKEVGRWLIGWTSGKNEIGVRVQLDRTTDGRLPPLINGTTRCHSAGGRHGWLSRREREASHGRNRGFADLGKANPPNKGNELPSSRWLLQSPVSSSQSRKLGGKTAGRRVAQDVDSENEDRVESTTGYIGRSMPGEITATENPRSASEQTTDHHFGTSNHHPTVQQRLQCRFEGGVQLVARIAAIRGEKTEDSQSLGRVDGELDRYAKTNCKARRKWERKERLNEWTATER